MAEASAGVRLNQMQVIGTHNSYHVAPHPSLAALIRSHGSAADSLDYTHRRLPEQFSRFGIRQIELDLFADPQGGRFSLPIGVQRAAENKLQPPPGPNKAAMNLPGIKVLHVPDFDYQTTVETFSKALEEVRDWSREHPAHVPILILLELKDQTAGAGLTQTAAWDEKMMASLEAEILQVFPRDQILAPDDVRGKHATLREAVLKEGWPELGSVRRKVLFALDNTDTLREVYMSGSANLSGKLLFVSVAEEHPAAAWFKLNDAKADFEKIQRLVGAGFMVRTRADTGTAEARQQDGSRRDRAFSSGAQFISTDYPEPQPSWGNYSVQWTNRIVARANAVSAPKLDPTVDLETLAIPALAPFPAGELDLLNARAIQSHEQRRLSEASADYDRLLALDPPRVPDQSRHAAMLKLAPVLRLAEGEPFELEQLVALHHPTRNVIAYHLFWDDDLDFPDDNDPTDHEVVWVEYDGSNLQSRRLFTYFHGRVLATDFTENQPAFAIEWGKHGSLPFGSTTDGQPKYVEFLRENWTRLTEHGTRRPDSPLAKGWPKRFNGDFASYARFPTELDFEAASGRVRSDLRDEMGERHDQSQSPFLQLCRKAGMAWE